MPGIICAVLTCLASPGRAAPPGEAADPRFRVPRIEVEASHRLEFGWRSSRCSDLDIPDAAARAFRDHAGRVVVLASHHESFLLVGDDFRSLRRDCGVVYRGRKAEDPALHDDRTWIAATWTEDGKRVAAVGHNEYHAHTHAGRCAYRDYGPCWYNSLVALVSEDGGRSFRRADAGRPLPIASVATRSEVGQGFPRGFFNPSNIVAVGDHRYLFATRRTARSPQADVCLFRAREPSEPGSWEIFDGDAFTPSAHNPDDARTGDGAPPATAPSCGPLRNLRGWFGSVSILPDGRFLAVVASHPHGHATGGIWASVSPDLIRWSEPRLVLPLPLFWAPGSACDQPYRYNYPAMLDEQSGDRNFSAVGARPRLYLVRAKVVDCGITMERDLISLPVSLEVEP